MSFADLKAKANDMSALVGEVVSDYIYKKALVLYLYVYNKDILIH